MNFTFAASKPPDMTFGSLKPDGNWTGMIGELVHQNADIGKVFKRYKLLQPFASNTVGPPVVNYYSKQEIRAAFFWQTHWVVSE